MGKSSKQRSLVNRKHPKGRSRSRKKVKHHLSVGFAVGKEKAMKKWKLEPNENAGRLVGNRVIGESTIIAYENHYKALLRFVALIGDFDSAIMLDVHCPEHAPSIKVETLILYLQYKFHDTNDLLIDLVGQPVKSIKDELIFCTASWNDPGNADQFRAAINCLHVAKNHSGPYIEFCSECCSLPRNERHRGCQHHLNSPRVRRVGNPVSDNKFYNAVKQIKKDGETYEIRGCDQLMPGEIRQIATYLRSTNNLKDLQTLVILLVSVSLFLRADDMQISMDDFQVDNLCLVTETGVLNLCVTIKGKSDNEIIYLYLWADDDCPELCPIRHLLVYIFLSGITSGNLFCSESELKCPPTDGNMVTSITYDVIKTRLQFLFEHILKNEDKVLGVHSLRKTAYLLGKLRGAELSDLMFAARHKSVLNAMKYELDAGLIKAFLKAQPDVHQRVSEWKAVRCVDHKAAKSVNARNSSYFKSLPQLSRDFVLGSLKVDKNDPKIGQVRYIIDKAIAYRRTDDAIGLLNKLFKEANISSEFQDKFLLAASMLSEERTRDTSKIKMPAPGTNLMKTGPTDEEMKRTTAKRIRGSGTEDLPGRKNVSSLKTVKQKIDFMLTLETRVPEDVENSLTSGALSFYKKYIKKVRTCLDAHFKIGGVASFCQKYNTYSHTKWKCTCHSP